MEKGNALRDGIIAVVTLIGLLGALAIVSGFLLASCSNADEAKQRLMDGGSGECWVPGTAMPQQ